MSQPLSSISVSQLKGVGPQLAEKLQGFGLANYEDLLFHLPLRYQDRTRIYPIGSLSPGMDVVIEAEVVMADVVMRRRRSLLCKVRDGSGFMTLRFFHFSAAQKNQMTPGAKMRCYGSVRPGPNGLEMVHPEYQIIKEEQGKPVEDHLTPLYPLTEGIQQPRMRSFCEQALKKLSPYSILDFLPDELLQHWQLPSLHDSIRLLHAPPPDVDQHSIQDGMHPAQRRLAFEELLAQHLSLLRLRHKTRKDQAKVLHIVPDTQHAFMNQLGFTFTNAQARVVQEVASDLASGHPMLRLVQGDVGSGKTAVAAMSMLYAVSSGQQAAIMAPTEILAEQHYQQFCEWFEPLNIKVGWLAGKVKGKKREKALAQLANGEFDIMVGTHALFQKDVVFDRLALVVIDEQHRFGVDQRMALRDKGIMSDQQLEDDQSHHIQHLRPHQLVMTATPIPRTLAMAAYADLDVSVIDELPPGRTPVETVAISDQRRDQVIDRLRTSCQQGRQAYWVCTLIEENEEMEAQAAEDACALLQQALPDVSVALVHGRMKPKEKADVMAAFKAGTIQVLVATTVIEVGVNVPNASVMVIENPERLGLAQLHQLRGRVGRGATESFCVLLYHAPLSNHGKARLQVMRETNDGFKIAEKDLEIRGPGEVMGTRQTGLVSMRVADLLRDKDMLNDVKTAADWLIRHAPDRVNPLIRRWLGHGDRYAEV
ncbi:ATP-dependent DNA helicase RecG [Litoribrevibacter euphylliae]|uniref:ATP-dependent DNA helicase RecG n=1 Tax=Litoribrevibacter euphylliae TaxID=1834034 RepID=A0ABV7HFE6_9GAMM